MYFIEDELHAEMHPGEFATLPDAVAVLRHLATVPWDSEPNRAPCQNWRKCGRKYVLLESDGSTQDIRQLRRIPMLELSHAGVRWLAESPVAGA